MVLSKGCCGCHWDWAAALLSSEDMESMTKKMRKYAKNVQGIDGHACKPPRILRPEMPLRGVPKCHMQKLTVFKFNSFVIPHLLFFANDGWFFSIKLATMHVRVPALTSTSA